MAPSRRQFLAAALPAGLSRADSGSGIIDSHTHFYDPSRPQGVPWPGKHETALYRTVLPAEFRRLTSPLGVTGTVVVEASPWLEDNQWILDLAKDEPCILAFVGSLPAGHPAFAEHLRRFAKDPLFRGVRLNGSGLPRLLSRPGFLDDLRRLADAGLSLDVLGGPEMLAPVLTISDRIPDLTVVIHHLPLAELAAQEAGAFRELTSRKNLYGKVSGVVRRGPLGPIVDPARYRETLEALHVAFGPDRVIYASNWPVCEQVAPYPDILRVVREFWETKGEEASRKFFNTNSQRAYKWRGR